MACLLLLCGLPASGKTTVAAALQEALEAAGHAVVTVRDGDDPLSAATTDESGEGSGETQAAAPAAQKEKRRRAQLYADSAAEKQTRAALSAATDRALATRRTVLVDSLNYIKGFRYELHCLARRHGARYALVHVQGVAVDTCVARDAARGSGEGYGESLTRALAMRFEPPSGARKWERPLHDAQGDASHEVHRAFARELASALADGTRLAVHKAVAATAAAAPDGLAALDRVTRAAEAALVAAVQAGATTGSSVEIPGATARVRLGRRPRVAEIRAMRRAFVSLSRLHVSDAADDARLADEFVAYVNAQVQAPR